MNALQARRLFAAARVVTLATVDDSGSPHLVPLTFALDGDVVWSAVDAKPKRAGPLRRHANIAANPRVSLLAQRWDEDWTALWWVRADGTATVSDEPAVVGLAVGLLRAKYNQYADVALGAPIIEVTVHTWRAWSANPAER